MTKDILTQSDSVGAARRVMLQLRVASTTVRGFGVVAAVFGTLYEPFRLLGPARRVKEWAAFVVAEGLRVEDLDSRPDDDVVRGLACALVDAGLKQVDVAVVVGEDQRLISRWRNALDVAGEERPSGPLRSKVSRAKSSKAVAAEVLAEAEAAARVPESGLILAETQLEPLPVFLSEYQAGLAGGAPAGPGVDVRIRRIHRELVNALGTVQACAQQRGILL